MTLPQLIRIFISSTFIDMQAEREELIKRIFPQLRNFCEQRRVVLREVDLRWGIPQNEIEEGKLLPTCLAEVVNCHPFFVCLLGDRYGTIIERIPEEILEDKPWLRDHQSKSITELEILQGVFVDPNPVPNAFFYFRRQNSSLAAYQGNSQHVDIKSIHKLENLKNRIVQSPYTLRDYNEPRELGELLFNDLTGLFERLFPIEKIPDPFEQENLEQNAFAETLIYGYSGLQKYFDAFDKHVKNQNSLIIVKGAVGGGKSALLANWAHRYRGFPVQIQTSNSLLSEIYRKIRHFLKPNAVAENSANSLLITHFVGSTEQSSDWAAILRRIMTFLKNHFQLSSEIPEARHLLPTAFASFLQSIPKDEKVILIIDGIDKINVDNVYSGFSWLPMEFPPNVKLILSASVQADLSELEQRNHSRLEMQPLRVSEREVVITNYLEQYRKSLNSRILRQIASVNTTANPLYLRTFLEELRLVARQTDELNRLSDYYLTAPDTQKIFEKLIIRLEKDFDSTASGINHLVRNTLCLLWASRSGLSENELAELLGTPVDPLPAAVWSPFYLSIKNHLLNRQGFLSFFHESFRQAVEIIYLETAEEKLKFHRQIAEYLKNHGSLSRQVGELPSHLAVLNDWTGLSALLADPIFLAAAWKTHKYEVQFYWSLVQSNSHYRLIDAYRPVIDFPAQYPDILWAVCSLLNEAGYDSEVLHLIKFIETQARDKNDNFELQASLSLKAEMLKKREDFDNALTVLYEAEVICRRLDIQSALAACFGNQAAIMYEKGNFETALALHQQEEDIYREIEDLAGLSISFGNQASNWGKKKDYTKSLELFRKQERICRQLGDISGLQKNFSNQGLVFQKTNKDLEAIKMFGLSEQICRKLNYLLELQACLGQQVSSFASIGDYDKADELLTEREDICRQIPAPVELAHTLFQKSRLYISKLNHPDFAVPLIEEAILLAEQHNAPMLSQEIKTFVSTDFAKRE